MSDPVPNMEIEDVLSSIRRLVSTGDRLTSPPASGQEATADKLVLTPALRVDDRPEDAVVQPNDLADEAQESDRYGDAPPAPPVAEPQSAPQGAVQAEQQGAAHAEDDHGPDAAAHEPGPEGLTARVAEFERVVAAREDQWEPDGTENANDAPDPISALQWQDVEDNGDQAEDHFGEEPQQVDENEGLEPYAPEEDDAAFVAEEAPAEAPAQEVSENAFLTDEDLLDDGADAILDEETLRDLVAEIVRQELQGSLGERITRNVRKLVRREIQRALAAQELE